MTDSVYRERAHLVALLAAVYPSYIGPTDPNEPDWNVATINLPTGQACWHIAPDDMDLFRHVRVAVGCDRPWDGHTTAAKYERIDQLTALLAQAAGPDEEQLGQMAVPRFDNPACCSAAEMFEHDEDCETRADGSLT